MRFNKIVQIDVHNCGCDRRQGVLAVLIYDSKTVSEKLKVLLSCDESSCVIQLICISLVYVSFFIQNSTRLWRGWGGCR
jgi:hypothetical protein